MSARRTMYQLPAVLKLGMYLSEVVIVNLLFYLFYKHRICPDSDGLFDVSTFYAFLSMCLTVAYMAGVAIRPISFYYRSDRRGSIGSNVFVAVTVMALLFWTLMLIYRHMYPFQTHRILLFFAAVYVALATWRIICRHVIRRLRTLGHNAHKVVFVGNTDTVLELYNEMRHPFYGYHVMGYFSDDPLPNEPAELRRLGVVGDVVAFLGEQPDVQQLYCSLPAVRSVEIRRIIDACESCCVRFFIIPQMRTFLKRKMQLEVLGSVPVLYIREDPLSMLTNRVIKRAFDIVVSGLFMIPFWLIIYPVIAILTHFLQPGPVFFKQKRNGLNGKEFYCYKFRSMKVNADSDRMQATKDDPRKTPFGNFMRKTSIDELPQFINVLKGDMSIVGPRPHMVAHTEEYSALIDKYMVRHWVRPGITGWAQVRGARGETKELWQMEDRIKKDVWYVENWTFSLDLKIMFLTVWNVIAGDKQAY